MSIIVRFKHLRAVGICNRESRIWFARQGWSWSDFISNGIPVERVEATRDPYALRVAAAARKEADEWR